MVVRSPKGETSSYYFEKGNAEAIYAYIGLPTAHWPDIYEAEAFNREYGLYISAPPGSSDKYPSYFGGAYLTTEGIVDFYNVTSKDTIDFTKKMLIPSLGKNGQGCSVKTYVRDNIGELYNTDIKNVDGSQELMAFYIGTIDPKNWGGLQEIAINYWGDSRTSHSAGTKYYWIDKEDHKIYIEDEKGNPIKKFYCGIWGKGSEGYFIILGGGTWLATFAADPSNNQTDIAKGIESSSAILEALGIKNTFSNNTSAHKAAPFFTVNGLIPNVEEAAVLTSMGVDTKVRWTDVKTYLEGGSSTEFVGKEFTLTNGSVTELYVVGNANTAGSSFTGLINLKPKTFFVIHQKSACEKTTKVSISNIGYDKWLYDYAVPFIAGDLSKITKEEFKKTGIDLFLSWDKTSFPATQPGAQPLTLYKFDYDLKGKTVADVAGNVGDDYVSQDFLIKQCYTIEGTELNKASNAGMMYNIYHCASKSAFFLEVENDSDYPLRKDINFNTITFKVTEEVYPGQETSGGEFTGSLSSTGKDSFGTNIYWPNVLSDNDFSFVEITPIQTFEETGLINQDGIYIGKRIVDDQLTEDFEGNSVGTNYLLKLKGQRYVSHIVEKNIKDGTVGGAWRDEFWQILQQGWNEAYDTNYDDVFVFMDPTGQEKVKTIQSSLVAGTHKLAIAISPKLITRAEFVNPSSIVVTARNKQCAQFVGEFKVYDEYTGKHFWCNPIGDVGLMCARIFEKKMGGWPPAWYNYNNMGGQLGRAVLEAKWRFPDNATQILDTKGINPIVFNADDGLMIVSSKTTQDPNNLTDWSFLEHVMSFVLVKREIRDNVMRPQIEKPIDDYWMGIAQERVDAILAKRITGSNKIWEDAKCDIKGVNTTVTKAQRKFVIYVKVKVTPFAQIVELVLENVGQTVSL